jgi:D-serine deaminase-like pyridoxal phosphate-dependent protein
MNKFDIPTPALTLDLDKFERNLERMATQVRAAGRDLRPHVKAHKCTEVARRQLALGAVGLCVATVPEAEAMHRAGFTGLLLTGPLGDPAKIQRVVATGAVAAVDHVRQVEWYSWAAKAPPCRTLSGHTTDLFIDLDTGDHRTGASSIDQILQIARAIAAAPNLRLRGLQAYSVSGSHGADRRARTQISSDCFSQARAAIAALRADGHDCASLTGGSTGTWDVDITIDGFTEMQAGSYAFMDVAYRRIGIDFENAITVQSTVISANHADLVTVDAGFKSFATDRPFGPEPVALPGAGYRWGGDEFGYVDLVDCPVKPGLGDRIEFLPPHCDPTVNLYARIYACRGESVEAVWHCIEK